MGEASTAGGALDDAEEGAGENVDANSVPHQQLCMCDAMQLCSVYFVPDNTKVRSFLQVQLPKPRAQQKRVSRRPSFPPLRRLPEHVHATPLLCRYVRPQQQTVAATDRDERQHFGFASTCQGASVGARHRSKEADGMVQGACLRDSCILLWPSHNISMLWRPIT